MIATLEQAVAISEFKIVPKPEEAKFCKGRWTKLIIALKNLNSESSIELTEIQIKPSSFISFKTNLNVGCKKLGFRSGTVKKGNLIYVFNRGGVK